MPLGCSAFDSAVCIDASSTSLGVYAEWEEFCVDKLGGEVSYNILYTYFEFQARAGCRPQNIGSKGERIRFPGKGETDAVQRVVFCLGRDPDASS